MDGEEGTGVEKWAKKKLQFIALVSFCSFLFSYYSGFSSCNLQFSTLIFSLFAHAIDRKYVFLICNGILALLVNNFTFFGFIKSAEDGAKQIPEALTPIVPIAAAVATPGPYTTPRRRRTRKKPTGARQTRERAWSNWGASAASPATAHCLLRREHGSSATAHGQRPLVSFFYFTDRGRSVFEPQFSFFFFFFLFTDVERDLVSLHNTDKDSLRKLNSRLPIIDMVGTEADMNLN